MSTTIKKNTEIVLLNRYMTLFLKKVKENPKSAWFLKLYGRQGKITGYTIQEDGSIIDTE